MNLLIGGVLVFCVTCLIVRIFNKPIRKLSFVKNIRLKNRNNKYSKPLGTIIIFMFSVLVIILTEILRDFNLSGFIPIICGICFGVSFIIVESFGFR